MDDQNKNTTISFKIELMVKRMIRVKKTIQSLQKDRKHQAKLPTTIHMGLSNLRLKKIMELRFLPDLQTLRRKSGHTKLLIRHNLAMSLSLTSSRM